MPSNLEARVIQLEIAKNLMRRALDQALQQLERLAQTVRSQAGAPYSGGGSGGGSGVFVALTSSAGIAAATAAPAGGVPGSAMCDVYLISGGAYTLVGSRTVYNPMLSATAAAVKVLTCHQNGDGTFTLSSESCA